MPDETNNHTITFKKKHLEILSLVTNAVVVSGAITLNYLSKEQEMDLVEAKNLIQQKLDFPDLEF